MDHETRKNAKGPSYSLILRDFSLGAAIFSSGLLISAAFAFYRKNYFEAAALASASFFTHRARQVFRAGAEHLTRTERELNIMTNMKGGQNAADPEGLETKYQSELQSDEPSHSSGTGQTSGQRPKTNGNFPCQSSVVPPEWENFPRFRPQTTGQFLGKN